MAGEDTTSAKGSEAPIGAAGRGAKAGPSPAQRAYLQRGLTQPGGKLPLFDPQGREVAHGTIRACLARGWAEPWFVNPIKPDWIVARLTDEGRRILGAAAATASDSDPA